MIAPLSDKGPCLGGTRAQPECSRGGLAMRDFPAGRASLSGGRPAMSRRLHTMMLPSKPIATLDMKQYAPYMFIKWDAPRGMFSRIAQQGE